MKPISNATLSPKEGYVEVEVDGVRQYRKIETERDRQITIHEAEDI